MSKSDSCPTVSQELAAEVLNKILENLQLPENIQKLDEARDNVGNEMLKMMQFIFPVVMKIEMDVIREYGFPDSREGIIKFSQLIRNYEREDPKIARLHGLIKAYYLPPVSVHTSSETEERNVSN